MFRVQYAHMWIGSRVKVMYIPSRTHIHYAYVYMYVYVHTRFSCVICMCMIKSSNQRVKETKLEIIMGRMSLATRSKVISTWKNGYQLSKIRARLLEEGVAVSKKSLCLNIRKYKLTGLVADRRIYKPPKKLNDAYYRFIDNAITENDELSAPKLYAT